MKLKMLKRTALKKSESGQIRRAGNIPAVLYSPGLPNEMISIDGTEFSEVLRKIISGRLATTKFMLVDGDKEVPAIIKEIQYHPTTYKVWHLDFQRMLPGALISVNVPIEFSGVAECAGIKLGGFLRTVLRQVKVICTSEKLPEIFVLDVRHLTMGQSLRLSAITMPEGVKPLTDLKEVAVVIAKR